MLHGRIHYPNLMHDAEVFVLVYIYLYIYIHKERERERETLLREHDVASF